MALLRHGISKQSALGSRVASTAVFYVHSQIQYTSARGTTGNEQIPQKLNYLSSAYTRQNDLSLLNYTKAPLQLFKTHNNNKQDLLHNGLPKDTISTKSALSMDILTSPTHLALMSLEYDKKWCKELRTVYSDAMKSRELLGYSTRIDDITHNVMHSRAGFYGRLNQVQLLAKFYPIEKQQANLIEMKSLDRDLCQNVISSNIVLFNRNQCSSLKKQTEEKTKKFEDKCDPLQLETVYQALRDELPAFFHKGHGYNRYHRNVKFINGLTNTTFSGLRTYKCIMTFMRLAAQTYMSDVRMEILKITKDTKECSVKVRWRVSGIPRYAFVLGPNQRPNENSRYVDGFSIFELDNKGLIYCHRLMKLMPSQSPQTDNPLWALNTAAVIALLRQQKSFEMLARQRVEDIEDTCLPF